MPEHPIPLRPLHRGQNLVLLARWRGRLVVVKRRSARHSHRYVKERDWLARGREAGVPIPPLVAALEGSRWLDLVLPPAPPRRRPWTPAGWLRRLAPLHTLPAPPGWGPLRADGRPRWRSLDDALGWYRARLDRLASPRATALAEDLADYRTTARARLIHGDCHRGNRAGDWILDWEGVAVADACEEAARAALADGWGPAAWARAAGVAVDGPRWRGALACAAIEAATTGGPRHAAGRRHLGL